MTVAHNHMRTRPRIASSPLRFPTQIREIFMVHSLRILTSRAGPRAMLDLVSGLLLDDGEHHNDNNEDDQERATHHQPNYHSEAGPCKRRQLRLLAVLLQ